MNKKNMFITTAVVSTVMIVGILAIGNNNVLSAFAVDRINEYGCKGNCTGEYEIRHVKSILQTNPEMNDIKNVRLLVKYAANYNGYQWYQDVLDVDKYNIFNIDANVTQLAAVSGITNGFDSSKFIKGDIIGIVGTVNLIGAKLQITEAIYYKWNSKEDLKLLPPVTYLQ